MHTLRLAVPVIRDARLTRRPFGDGDTEAVIDASSDPLIPKITTVPQDADKAAALAFIARQHERAMTGEGFSFAIEAGSECVGQIGVWLRDLGQGRATVGYWIRPSRRRRGHASAALSAAVTWAFSALEVDRLQLVVEPWNIGSWSAAERAGFEREGLLRSWELVGDERRDMLMYGLTREHHDREARTTPAPSTR